jgi:hypothetical protein
LNLGYKSYGYGVKIDWKYTRTWYSR